MKFCRWKFSVKLAGFYEHTVRGSRTSPENFHTYEDRTNGKNRHTFSDLVSSLCLVRAVWICLKNTRITVMESILTTDTSWCLLYSHLDTKYACNTGEKSCGSFYQTRCHATQHQDHSKCFGESTRTQVASRRRRDGCYPRTRNIYMPPACTGKNRDKRPEQR